MYKNYQLIAQNIETDELEIFYFSTEEELFSFLKENSQFVIKDALKIKVEQVYDSAREKFVFI